MLQLRSARVGHNEYPAWGLVPSATEAIRPATTFPIFSPPQDTHLKDSRHPRQDAVQEVWPLCSHLWGVQEFQELQAPTFNKRTDLPASAAANSTSSSCGRYAWLVRKRFLPKLQLNLTWKLCCSYFTWKHPSRVVFILHFLHQASSQNEIRTCPEQEVLLFKDLHSKLDHDLLHLSFLCQCVWE